MRRFTRPQWCSLLSHRRISLKRQYLLAKLGRIPNRCESVSLSPRSGGLVTVLQSAIDLRRGFSFPVTIGEKSSQEWHDVGGALSQGKVVMALTTASARLLVSPH